MSFFKKLNTELVELHEFLSDNEELSNLSVETYEPLIHATGTQGKVVRNRTILPDQYYKLYEANE